MAFVSASVSDGTSQPFGRSLFSLWVSQKKKKKSKCPNRKASVDCFVLGGAVKTELKTTIFH